MYDQMFNDIDAHLKVVWQSIAVVVGAFAIFSLVEKKVISIDVASTLVVVITAWLLANLIDAGYWYNRNLVIIANIERDFLRDTDLREIHYYFGSHRPKNKMFSHLRIQFAFGVAIGIAVVLWHFLERVLPALRQALFDPAAAIPYAVMAAAVIYLIRLRRYGDRKYQEFVQNSPGKEINTTGIQYGEGHGFPRRQIPRPPPDADGPSG